MSSVHQGTYKILFGFYDIFPARKGSSVRTRGLFSRLTDANVTIFAKLKSGQLSHEAGPPFEIYRARCDAPPPFRQSSEFVLKFKEFLHQKDLKGDLDYDIWHSRSPFDGYLLAQEAEKRGIPMIFEVNGLPSIEWPYHYPKILKKNQKALRRLSAMELLTALTATHIIVPSKVTREYLISHHVSREKITVIPNGVSRNFKPERCPPESRAQLLELPHGWEERILVGYIGALQSWQGVHSLIESLASLRSLKGKESFGLVLMGKSRSSWRHSLRKIGKKHGVRELVHFCHPRPQSLMPKILNSFDIAVAPLADTPRNTLQGCNPIKLYEYAASGLPIITSDLPVTREILPENSLCRFVPPDSPLELGESLKDLIQNPIEREEQGRRARNYFLVENNDWRNRAMLLQRLYSSLLAH